MSPVEDIETKGDVPMTHPKDNVGIHKVEEVDMTVYDFTEEESRALCRKFDWHVSCLSNTCINHCAYVVMFEPIRSLRPSLTCADSSLHLVVLPLQLARS